MDVGQAKKQLSQLVTAKRVLSEHEQLEPYSVDESGLGSFPPDLVVLAESTQEISEVLKLAAKDKLVVTPRGAGTGMTGGALAVQGGVLLSTERMARIKDIDRKNLLAVVEPGVITGQLQEEVEEAGLFYPPDPASLDSCSIGGNVAENAGGPRAFRYGVTREYVLGLELVRMGGEVMRLGHRTVKGVTGLDLTALVVGSEGTLGVVSEIILKLLPKPQGVIAFSALFPDAPSATEAVSSMIAQGYRPRTMEFLDGTVLEHLRQEGKWAVPAAAGALLLIELDGEQETLEDQMLRTAEVCEEQGAVEIMVATDEQRRRQLWEMRRNASPCLKAQHRFRVSEDVVVPRAVIPEMVRRLDLIAAEEGVTIANFGHAGDGNLHVNVLYDDEAIQQRLDSVLKRIFAAALDLGGTLSGEHGVGISKRRFMTMEQGPDLLQLQQQVKRLFDPENLLNPGKIWP